MTAIPLLIFDLDGTLVDSLEDLRRSANLFLGEHGLPELDTDTLRPCIGRGVHYLVRCMIDRAGAIADGPEALHPGYGERDVDTRGAAGDRPYAAGDRPYAAGRSEEQGASAGQTLSIGGREMPLDDAVARYREIYAAHAMDTTAPYPGVPETLAALRRFPMAVISNKPEAASREILTALELARYFRVIAGGDTFEEMKPSGQPILRVIERVGASKEHTWMIGDSSYDIEAGKNAGVRTAAVTYGFQSSDILKALEPDRTVSAFSEFREIFLSDSER